MLTIEFANRPTRTQLRQALQPVRDANPGLSIYVRHEAATLDIDFVYDPTEDRTVGFKVDGFVGDFAAAALFVAALPPIILNNLSAFTYRGN